MTKHVSAAGLTSTNVPTLLQQQQLNPSGKAIWDDAYAEEVDGLSALPCWTVLSEKEFRRHRTPHTKILPTMAVSTIKFDKDGLPVHAKYRIVALGNFETTAWSKTNMYAPVMALLELCLLTDLAVCHKCVLKNGDVKQAFVQAMLPPDEQYILKPPPGCPKSPPNLYWLLKHTLYGLCHSARHWFERATELLKQSGLTQCPNAPCMFHGTLLPGEPPYTLVSTSTTLPTSPRPEK